MTTETDRLYAMAVADLSLPYIALAGDKLRTRLDRFGAAEMDYQPGDGTRYPISLVRLDRLEVGRIGGLPSWPGVDYETGVLVALGGGYGNAYAINLLGRHERIHYSYIHEKLMGDTTKPNASAVAVALLLDAVAGFAPEGLD